MKTVIVTTGFFCASFQDHINQKLHQSHDPTTCSEVGESLGTVAKFLQASLQEWQELVNELRNDFACLNFYSTDQLVCLSSAIASLVFKNEPLSLQSGMLLKFACGNVDMVEIERTIKKLHTKIGRKTCRFFQISFLVIKLSI